MRLASDIQHDSVLARLLVRSRRGRRRLAGAECGRGGLGGAQAAPTRRSRAVMQTVSTDAFIKLPPELAVCPICGAEVVIEDIDEYEQNDDGTWQASESGLHINCITEP